MAVGFVAGTSGGTADSVADSTVTVTPASTVEGDLLLLWLVLTNGTATAPTVTAPDGWDLLDTAVDGAAPQLWGGLYSRTVTASEPATALWSFSTGTNAAWACNAWTGAAGVLHARVDPYLGSTATKVTESITTTVDSWVVSGFGDRSGGVYSGETDTERATFRHTAYATPCGAWTQDSAGDVTAGAQTRTITGPAGTSVGVSFILALEAATTVPARTFPDPLQDWLTAGPMYVAHRGGSADFVEMTAAAYASSVAAGVRALEMSVWRTVDGVWVAHHDQTTGRVCGTDLDIPTSTWAQLSVLTSLVGGHPIARALDLLDAYPDQVWFVDNKLEQNITEWLDLLDERSNSTGRFVIKGPYGSGTFAAGRPRGYCGWAIYYDDELGDLEATFAPWDLLGLNYDADSADWATITDTGKPVLGHVCLTLEQVTTAFTQEASGVMTGKVIGVIPAYTEPAEDPGAGAGTGGWDQLLDIYRQQRADAAQAREEERNPAACPNDGEPLRTGPDGRLFCIADGWRPN